MHGNRVHNRYICNAGDNAEMLHIGRAGDLNNNFMLCVTTRMGGSGWGGQPKPRMVGAILGKPTFSKLRKVDMSVFMLIFFNSL